MFTAGNKVLHQGVSKILQFSSPRVKAGAQLTSLYLAR